jgi:hypothetical protein
VNATAQSNKGSTLQRMERAVSNTRAVAEVDSSVARFSAAGDSTEAFLFHRVHTVRSGGVATPVHAHFKATVRTARRRRRYLRASRQTLAEVRYTAAIYNEARKAGASIEQAHRVVRAVHSLNAAGGCVGAPGSDAETAPLPAATGSAVPVSPRTHRSTWTAAMARAITAVTPHRKNRTVKGNPVPSVLPATSPARATRAPELFTHVDALRCATQGPASLPVRGYGAADVPDSTPTAPIRLTGRNSGGGVRLDVVAAPSVAKRTPPEKGTRSLQRVED